MNVGVAIIKAVTGGLYKVSHDLNGPPQETLCRSPATLTVGQRVICGRERAGSEVVLFPGADTSPFRVGVVTASTPTNDTVGAVDVVVPCSALTYTVKLGTDANDEDAPEYGSLTPRVRQFRDVGMAPAPDGSQAVLLFVPNTGGEPTVVLESVAGEWVPTDPECA